MDVKKKFEGPTENYLYTLEIEIPSDSLVKEVLLLYADEKIDELKKALKTMGGKDVYVSTK